jgi:hypothetical protein
MTDAADAAEPQPEDDPRWSGYDLPDGTVGLLAAQAGMTVSMIQTPRRKLVCCSVEDTVAAAVRGHEHFDYLPVRAADVNVIVGVLGTSLLRSNPSAGSDRVADRMCKLDERWIVGGGMCLVDFVRSADEHPCRLVVDGGQITGIACLSDLQKLPTRAALFGLITGIEMMLVQLILSSLAGDRWKRHLNDHRVKKIAQIAKQAMEDNSYIHEILFTELSDKIAIVMGGIWDGEGIDVSADLLSERKLHSIRCAYCVIALPTPGSTRVHAVLHAKPATPCAERLSSRTSSRRKFGRSSQMIVTQCCPESTPEADSRPTGRNLADWETFSLRPGRRPYS